MIIKLIFTPVFLLVSVIAFGQLEKEEVQQGIGLNYFGELGFRPGLELDYGRSLWMKESKKTVSPYFRSCK